MQYCEVYNDALRAFRGTEAPVGRFSSALPAPPFRVLSKARVPIYSEGFAIPHTTYINQDVDFVAFAHDDIYDIFQ
jgi:hypothetical protein